MNTNALILAYRMAYLKLLEAISRAPEGSYSRMYRQAVLRDVARILKELDADAIRWAEVEIPKAYEAAQAEALAVLRGLSLTVPEAPVASQIHREAIKALVENASSQLLEAHRMVGRRISDSLRQLGLNAITEKVSTGATIDQTRRVFATTLAQNGFSAIQTRDGRQIRLDAYAETVARTTTAEATNRGTLNQLGELGFDLVRMSEHNSACPICAQYEGRVYSISGKDPRFPKLFGTAFGQYANIHPNCRHRLTPYIPELASDLQGDISRSNQPFSDNRSEAQRRAYEKGQKLKADVRAARGLWERYKAAGLEPPPFPSFVRMRREDSKGFQVLQKQYRERNL